MSRILFTAIVSPAGDTDRAIFVVDADGSDLTALFDVPGSYDSCPAWSPDGRRIAFESNANIDGANPEGDLEIWTMAADGSGLRQLTRNALHDEGPAWSPDGGRMLAYTSGADNTHGDINVMTSGGRHLRRLAPYAGLDESPDWQAIPAPKTARRCGDAVRTQRPRRARTRPRPALPRGGRRRAALVEGGEADTDRRLRRAHERLRRRAAHRDDPRTRDGVRQLLAFLYGPDRRAAASCSPRLARICS